MQRIFVFDNVKSLMILLVVFGHLIEPLIGQSYLIKIIYLSIYSIHMPMFVAIAGMMTKNIYSETHIDRSIRTTLVPFLVFTILYEAFNLIVDGEVSTYTRHLQPYWILWFLYSLFVWKIFLPIALNFRNSIVIAISISIAAGYVSSINYFLGISRTLYFFPFFLIGYLLSPSIIDNARLTKVPKIFFVIIILANVAGFWWFKNMSEGWLRGSLPYSALTVADWSAAIKRLCLYGVSFFSIIAVIMLIPNKNWGISRWGKNSLYIFLWHGFFIKLLIGAGLIGFLGKLPAVLTLIAILLLAVAITLSLSVNLLATCTRYLILGIPNNLLLDSNQARERI